MIPPPNLPPTLAPQLSLPHLARRAEPSPRSTGSDSLSYSLARLPPSFAPAGLRLCGCATGDAAAYPICGFRSRFVHRCAILSETMLGPMKTEHGGVDLSVILKTNRVLASVGSRAKAAWTH